MTEQEFMASDDPAAMLRLLMSVKDDLSGTFRPSDRKLRLFACACVRQVWNGVPCGACAGTGKPNLNFLGIPAPHVPSCNVCEGSGRVGGLTDPRSRNAVEVAERYADGEAKHGERSRASEGAHEAYHPPHPTGRESSDAASACCWVAAEEASEAAAGVLRWLPYPAAQADLLREVVGNPFRSVTLPYGPVDPPFVAGEPNELRQYCPWLTPTVLDLAHLAYDGRYFDLLPILADALEDAGCVEETLLRHLRGEERCWVCCPENRSTCYRCRGSGYAGVMCAQCAGRGVVSDRLASPGMPRPCPMCDAKGALPITHVRGCWALDLLLGKS